MNAAAIRSGLARIAALVMGLVLAWVLAELGLRVLGIEHPSFYQAHSVLGVALRPGAEGWFGGEGQAFVRINSAGMRDRERPQAKPPGTYRIALLGDSYAMAKQVDVEQAFPRRVERELASSCPSLAGQSVDVLNFGVSGYGTGHEWLLLRERVWDFEPDLVVLTFLTGNDLLDNSPDLHQRELEPRFRLVDGRPVADFSFRESAIFRRRTSTLWQMGQSVIDHSRVIQVGNEAKNAWARWQAARREDAQTAADRGEIGLDPRVYVPPTDRAWREAWRITEALLASVQDEVRAHGVPFALVILSNAIQSHPDVQTRGSFMARHGIESLFHPDERLLRFADARGIPALALAPELQRYAETTGSYLHGFENTTLGIGHWNEAGHREASRRIAPFLCELVTPALPEAVKPALPEAVKPALPEAVKPALPEAR